MRIIVILLVLTAQLFSQSLIQKLDSLYALPLFDTTVMAVDIKNLTKNETVYTKNNKLLLHPASNMKILTSMAGVLFLGPDYTFNTSFYLQGEVVRGTLFGNMIVKGTGDPDLQTGVFDTVVQKLRSLGIYRINGNLIGDISYQDKIYWGNGWMWDDDPSTDFPYMTPLTINDNAITVVVEAAKSGELTISTIPPTKYVTITNSAAVSSNGENSISITRNYQEDKDEIVISGKISAGKSARTTVNLRFPEKYFLTLLREQLELNGIRITGELKTTDTLNYSPTDTVYTNKVTLDSIIVNLNKTSDNLSTEMLLRALAVHAAGAPATADNGIQLVDSLITLAGYNPLNYRIVDGSGVSHYNLISAELIRGLLEYLYTHYKDTRHFEVFKNSQPIAGVDGSLKNRMKNSAAEGKVFAKTGTLSGVSCLSGYTTNSAGDTIVFSIMMQNHYRAIRRMLEIQNYIGIILSE